MQVTLLVCSIALLVLFCCILLTHSFAGTCVAIKGYDPVAYFTQNKAIRGNNRFILEWLGRQWRFSSEQNRDAFILSPQRYIPQYDGYCAFGCSESHFAVASPTAWAIVNDKLYFNYSNKYKKIWLKDKHKRIEAADAYWSVAGR